MKRTTRSDEWLRTNRWEGSPSDERSSTASGITRCCRGHKRICYCGEPPKFEFRVRRGKARIFSGCKSRPVSQSLQPEAIGTAVEATKPPEPSMERVALAT